MSDVAAPAPATNGATAPAAPAQKTPVAAPGKEATPAISTKPNGKAPAKAPPPAGEAGKVAEAPKEDLFEIVVNGEKKQLTREQAIRQLQKDSAADERFRKGGEAVKKANTILSMLKDNPREALTQLGVDVRGFSEQVLREAVEEAELTPEQKQHRQDTKELERLRNFEKQQKELGEKQAQAEKDKALFAQLEKGILEHAERGGLEGTPDNLQRISETALELIDLEVPFTPEQLIAEVKEREEAAFGKLEKKVLGGLKGEALAKRLGPTVVEEILQWSIQKLRGGPPAAAKPAAAPSTPAEKKSPYMTEKDFDRKHGF